MRNRWIIIPGVIGKGFCASGKIAKKDNGWKKPSSMLERPSHRQLVEGFYYKW